MNDEMALLHRAFGDSLRAKDAVKAVRHVRRELQQRGGGGDDVDKEAWENALNASEAFLPEDVTRDKLVMKGRKGLGIPANTSVAKAKITISYDTTDEELPPAPDDDEYTAYLAAISSGAELDEDMEELAEDINCRIGELTSTFVHEIIIHANYSGLDPDDEHDQMHTPGVRDRYFAASMAAVALLKNDTQKEAFAEAWENDLNDQLDEYEERTEKEDPERRKWIKTQRKVLFPESQEDS